MTEAKQNDATTIVAFDPTYRLVAVFHSISEAAKMTKTIRQSLIKAAYGEIISVANRYWRVLPADFQLEPDDIGQLTIFEFDAAVGEDRRIYATRKMLKNSAMLESEYLILKQNTEQQ